MLGEAEMTELGMGALLGVSQGSARDARLLALKWNGGRGWRSALALVGKGVTFDTGGISLKPGAGMEDMKWDMGGAGAVVGAMKALAAAQGEGECHRRVRPGREHAGRQRDPAGRRAHLHVRARRSRCCNTDAEGRLVLCDALTWVQRTHHPRPSSIWRP